MAGSSPLKDVAANICWVHRIEKEMMSQWSAKFEPGVRKGPRNAMSRTSFTKSGFIEPKDWPPPPPPLRASTAGSASTPSLRSRLGFAADPAPRQQTPSGTSLASLSRTNTPSVLRSRCPSRASHVSGSRQLLSRGSDVSDRAPRSSALGEM
eukprot:CAMPEP_0175218964 /NCGR_PEP_ID=MMETSP0093-20121207/19026_1 /TAXON_ID=311494 /ORGANISM="Alexandrium monilatum, Strain CCMP3105" /LENGTH=151 /DNA_ID=CAMNT_0016512429 /DNA_START=41 /DNA_END=496 /DNA_ORIENTATION=+